jgi:TRAP-type C4-dicarboxylate transport system permease small subunit
LQISNGINHLNKFIYKLSSWFEYLAIIAFLGMMVSIVIDVVGAKLFQWPLPVGTEAVYLLQLIAIAAALAYSQIDGRHIRVEFIVDKLPRHARSILYALAALLGLALFAILLWESYEYGQTLRLAKDVTATSKIPLFPFAFWLTLSFIPVCLVLLVQMLNAILEVFKK